MYLRKGKTGNVITAMLLALLLTACGNNAGGKSDLKAESDGEGEAKVENVSDQGGSSRETTSGKKDSLKGEIGDIIAFGTYEQDNDTGNGTEPIEWIILDKGEDGSLFLISKYALEAKQYTVGAANANWENASLRTWLNDEFYKTAFSDAERDMIKTTKVVAHPNVKYNKDAGNDTEDRIFLLSGVEAEQYFPNDEGEEGEKGNSQARKAQATTYAIAKGLTVRAITEEDGRMHDFRGEEALEIAKTGDYAVEWFLRTPGQNAKSTVSRVSAFGSVGYGGISSNRTGSPGNVGATVKMKQLVGR